MIAKTQYKDKKLNKKILLPKRQSMNHHIFSLTLANKHYCTKNIYIYIIIVLVLKRYIIHEKVGIIIFLSRNKEQ